MPHLIKNIDARILDNFNTDVTILSISSVFGTDGYFKVFGIVGILQDFTKIIESNELNISNQYGLKYNNNKEFEILEISY